MKISILRTAGAAVKKATAGSQSPCAFTHLLSRSYYSTGYPERKVAILGAAGGIRQSLALLMKLNPSVSSLSLYDIANTPGVAADVSHIKSPAQSYRLCR